MRNLLVFLSMVMCAQDKAIANDAIQLPVTEDNSIVMVDGEWDLNAGQQGRIRVKGNQHMLAMAFDTSAIEGRRIKKATLVCVQGEQTISGVTISTIATPWNEQRSNGLTAGIDGINGWGYGGARFPAVCGGNAFTLVHQANSVIRDGKYYWDVPPDMVHAMAIGVAHGLAIHEHDADTGRNPTIFAREQSGKSPFLSVELDDADEANPEVATELRLVSVGSASAQLVLVPPKLGFAYEVTIDGKVLGRHNTPLVMQGHQQTIPLRDLPESIAVDQPVEIKVVTLNRTGSRSQPATLRGVILKSASIETPVVTFASLHSSMVAGLSVIPVADKYDAAGRSCRRFAGRLSESQRNL